MASRRICSYRPSRESSQVGRPARICTSELQRSKKLDKMKTYKELKDKNEGYQEDQNLADLVGGEASDMIKALKKGDVRKAKTSYKAIGRLLK